MELLAYSGPGAGAAITSSILIGYAHAAVLAGLCAAAVALSDAAVALSAAPRARWPDRE